ncbi:MAG: GTPase Era [Spirochaetales bacterium]|nr:GTPase Era [Spirochaetales bacterium]
MKSGFIAIVGRPSCGKSTFLNTVCGQKVSIVSPVPQTTRNKVRGIYNSPDKESQLVFIDTPGFHTSEKKFNLYMKRLVASTIDECDAVLYIIDASRDVGEEERAIMKIITETSKPIVIALNKMDVKQSYFFPIVEELKQDLFKVPFFSMSALNNKGIDEVLTKLIDFIPEGEPFYPAEFYTDQPPEFRISEIIREKAISVAKQELPHCIYIEILDMEMRKENAVLWVRGFIYVERMTQRGILVGRNGEKIKQILQEARKEIEELFPYAVYLDFRVKVQPKWRKKDHIIKKLME